MSTHISNGHMDTTSAVAAVVSFGGAIAGELSPHPMQYVVWGIAIIAGLVSIVSGIKSILRDK